MLARKSKRFLAMFLAMVMLLGLLPMSALAVSGGDGLHPGDLYYDLQGDETGSGNAAVTLSKTAERTAVDEWEVTLSVNVGNTSIEQQPLEVVFVLDASGSMSWCTEEHSHDSTCFGAECTRDSNPGHWTKGFFGNWKHIDGTDCTYRKQNGDVGYYPVICGKYAHTHSNNEQPCAGVKKGGLDSRLDIARNAITSMVTDLQKELGTSFTAKFVIFSTNGYETTWASAVPPRWSPRASLPR